VSQESNLAVVKVVCRYADEPAGLIEADAQAFVAEENSSSRAAACWSAFAWQRICRLAAS